jgi:glycosyltransferase involved in cell wall biosynthesis
VLKAFARANLSKHTRIVFLQRLFAKGRWHALGVERIDRLAASLSVADRVVWLPSVSQADLVRLYQGALALVQFSRFEGFGFPTLEALACGTPVIASDIPPLREVSGGAALHVPLEIASLAGAMERIATSKSLAAELSGRGVERAKDFSWDRAVAQHLEVYREVLTEQG